MTETIALNRGWEFTEAFDDAFLRGKGSFPRVELPHTCREVPYSYFDEALYQMDSGYRIRLTVPPAWAGRRVFLHIGAAGHHARVYADGRLIAEYACGYTAFRAELTDALTPGGETLVVIRVDSRESQNIPPFGHVIDYMTFGGLYREVSLVIRSGSFIEDVFTQPKPDLLHGTGLLTVDTALAGFRAGSSYTLRYRVFPCGCPDRIIAEAAAPVTENSTNITIDCGSISLWTIDDPALYVVRTTLFRGSRPVDEQDTRFGFREARFRADGFWLNGKKRRSSASTAIRAGRISAMPHRGPCSVWMRRS